MSFMVDECDCYYRRRDGRIVYVFEILSIKDIKITCFGSTHIVKSPFPYRIAAIDKCGWKGFYTAEGYYLINREYTPCDIVEKIGKELPEELNK